MNANNNINKEDAEKINTELKEEKNEKALSIKEKERSAPQIAKWH